MWQYQNTDELYHHGILGQKWGVRRYQNPDGTLTPAGRRKAGKLASKYAKVTGKKLIVKKKSVEQNKPKTVKEMSDYELQQKINRIYLEKSYEQAIKSQAPKQKVSKGKKFISTVNKKVIAPSMVKAGRTATTKLFTAIGNNMVNSLLGYNDSGKVKNNMKKDLYNNVNKGKNQVQKVYKDKVIKNQYGTITIDGDLIKFAEQNKKKK